MQHPIHDIEHITFVQNKNFKMQLFNQIKVGKLTDKSNNMSNILIHKHVHRCFVTNSNPFVSWEIIRPSSLVWF